jgi:ubiquinone/menaquinone biosynthesis C-methylase UbiE
VYSPTAASAIAGSHSRPRVWIPVAYLRSFPGAGYVNAVGMDFSEKMLMRGRSQFPHLTLVRNDGLTLPFRDQAFDAVLFFTVLTCIPSDGDQLVLLAEVKRVLRPEGILYISD